MANLRDSIGDSVTETEQSGQVLQATKMEPVKQVATKLGLTAEECKFLLSKVAAMDFKGVEIEFVYNLILKLQEIYKDLSNDK